MTDFTQYARDPAKFAREILGSEWWEAQERVAELVQKHRHVAVKAANGVGKTYIASDLALWFLYCHTPSVVLTTAPTWRQVESLLWEEIRRRHQKANRDRAQPVLPGTPNLTKLKLDDGHFAMGLSTDEPVRFQGFHAENLLVILDEACGVTEEIWDAVEGICVGGNNRVLALSNPLQPSGRFYTLFQTPHWATETISALMHPNVVGGRALIPGAVTREAIEERIAAWCEEVEADGARAFTWEGRWYRPNAIFRVRVLGEFPEAGEDSLFHLDWIERSMQEADASEEEETKPVVVAADVARFGMDETVVAVRRGRRITRLSAYRGLDTMQVAEVVRETAAREAATYIVVDGIGIGAGVADRLNEMELPNVLAVNFSSRATTARAREKFLNLRAQTYWGLSERMRAGRIGLPKDSVLSDQLRNLRYHFADSGLIQIESKDALRARGLPSPDRADAVALAFSPQAEPEDLWVYSISRPPCDPRSSRPFAPVRWGEVGRW